MYWLLTQTSMSYLVTSYYSQMYINWKYIHDIFLVLIIVDMAPPYFQIHIFYMGSIMAFLNLVTEKIFFDCFSYLIARTYGWIFASDNFIIRNLDYIKAFDVILEKTKVGQTESNRLLIFQFLFTAVYFFCVIVNVLIFDR